MKKTLLALGALAAALAVAPGARADLVTDDVAACFRHQAGQACDLPLGGQGLCVAEWNDWKKHEFLACRPGPAKPPGDLPPALSATPVDAPAPKPGPSSAPSPSAAPSAPGSTPGAGCALGAPETLGGPLAAVLGGLAVAFLAARGRRPRDR